jgi:hypothetical protein
MDKTPSPVREIPPGPLVGPSPRKRTRRLAIGSLHGEHRFAAPRARQPIATWRTALFIGGVVTLPAVVAVAALFLLARAAGPMTAELASRSWPLLVPLALGLTSWSALLALRHAETRLSDGVPVEEIAAGDAATRTIR